MTRPGRVRSSMTNPRRPSPPFRTIAGFTPPDEDIAAILHRVAVTVADLPPSSRQSLRAALAGSPSAAYVLALAEELAACEWIGFQTIAAHPPLDEPRSPHCLASDDCVRGPAGCVCACRPCLLAETDDPSPELADDPKRAPTLA